MLKKCNAILALFTAGLALIHTVMMSLLLTGLLDFHPVFGIIGTILLRIFCIHTMLSLIILLLTGGSGLNYPLLNKSILEQRIAAILLMVFVHFHMQNYFVNQAVVAPSVFGFVTELLFPVVIMSHFMPSVDKVLTTLGLYRKTAVTTIKVIALAAFVLSLAAVSVYYLGAML